MITAKSAGVEKFGETLNFETIYENGQAVCGTAIKAQGVSQRFIFVRKHFFLEEMSPSGEWETIWYSECD